MDAGSAAEPAPVDVPVVDRANPLIEPITPRMLARLRAIVAARPDLRDDVFAKMGGSSVVNRSFLHCFEDEPVIDFGGRDLDATLAHFRAGRVLSHSPFGRTSLAAGVGWSIRQAFAGRPSAIARELDATQARFALAYFGGNDVEGRSPRQFVQRLDRLVTMLAARGVIPVIASTYPRRPNDRDMNEQVERHNRLSRGLALAHGLPFVDVHQAMLPLPGRGLAADGYHPNTYVVGPRARACDFGPVGLEHGNNHRNLLTLQALDGLRRTVLASEPPPGVDVLETGVGTVADPALALALPFARRLAPSDLEAVDSQPGCVTEAFTGRYAVRVVMPAAGRLRLSAVPMGALEARVVVTSAEVCRVSGDEDFVVELPAGPSTLTVLTRTPRRPTDEQRAAETRLLLVFTREP